jgi:ADP-ribosylation factor-binding protein GGA
MYRTHPDSPREAATLLVRLVNHRNPHVGLLALGTIDTLAQACGYPFHLQLATKEFLNELVRRFPERPPPFPGAVMQRVLDLLHTWKNGICADSRWRADLGNIRDMHRLLTFKGYRFRDAPAAPAPAALAGSLRTADELEEEDRAAQSAKLQELIRRGTPRDLAAAQEIMKALAGADPDAKPDYRAQALADLAKLEQKVVLLSELLDNFDVARGEKFAPGDAYAVGASPASPPLFLTPPAASRRDPLRRAPQDPEVDQRCLRRRLRVPRSALPPSPLPSLIHRAQTRSCS